MNSINILRTLIHSIVTPLNYALTNARVENDSITLYKHSQGLLELLVFKRQKEM